MAGPTREEGAEVSFRAHEVISCILSAVPKGVGMKGRFADVMYDVMIDQQTDLIKDNVTFQRQYGYCPTLTSSEATMLLGGTLVNSSNNTFSVVRKAYHGRIAEEKFDEQQREYLQGLGRQLVDLVGVGR